MPFEEDVERGMILLDQRKPGWESELNLSTLDISSSYDCILGQLYGDYGSGLVELGVMNGGTQYGFSAPYHGNIDETIARNAILTAVWKHMVGQRWEHPELLSANQHVEPTAI